MKYLIKNVFIPITADLSDRKAAVVRACKVSQNDLSSAKLFKKSVDARKKDNIRFCCSFIIESELSEKRIDAVFGRFSPEKYNDTPYVWPRTALAAKRPVVVGFGPAGMFCALALARAGLDPIVLERGDDADSRVKAVNKLYSEGILNTESNIQFGEGGAGTFSDGKLNTGIKDSRCRAVLEELVRFGAKENILYDAKPHIGTDILINVVKNLRREITALGGEVRFLNKLTDIKLKNNAVCGVTVASPEGDYELNCDSVILCIGHSARDTFEMLFSRLIPMTSKAFAVGARIEHPQELINTSQYGDGSLARLLGAADYKLSCHLENGRGVYTFCMCPGGYVVNASSEEGGVVTNGMSYNARDGKNANSALLVGVDSRDFGDGVLDGMYFQREIEKKAFRLSGSYRCITQTVGNFLSSGNGSVGTVSPTVRPSPISADLCEIFPRDITDAMKQGIKRFDSMIKGFADPCALLTGPETRSSSPVRILRGESRESTVGGLYPVGEGAGYAGGIMSAAVDGLRTAEAVIQKYS